MSTPKGTLQYPRTEPVMSMTAYRTISQRIEEYAISMAQLSQDIKQINFACRFIRSKRFPSILYFELEDAEQSDWNFIWKFTTRILVREYSISQLVPSRDAKDALVQALMSPDSKPYSFSSKRPRVLGVREFYYFFVIIDDFLPELFSSFLSPSLSQKSKKRADATDEKKYPEANLNSGIGHNVPAQLISECPICLDKLTSQVLPCGHAYCETCLESWCLQEHNCPMCRIRVNTTDVQESWQICEGIIDKGKIQQEYLENLRVFPYGYINLFPEK